MAVSPDPQSSGFPLWEVGVALATLILSFVMSAISGTWILGKSRSKLSEKIDEARLDLERKIDQEIDTVNRNFGETVTAAKTKMTEMELWGRDNYVNKATFNVVMAQLRSDSERLEDKIDRRFDRLEAKLDDNHKAIGSK
jgi:hypothetical protein